MNPDLLRVEAGGLSFTCITAGPDDGPLALCLHGFPDTAHAYRHLLPRLASSARVRTQDLDAWDLTLTVGTAFHGAELAEARVGCRRRCPGLGADLDRSPGHSVLCPGGAPARLGAVSSVAWGSDGADRLGAFAGRCVSRRSRLRLG